MTRKLTQKKTASKTLPKKPSAKSVPEAPKVVAPAARVLCLRTCPADMIARGKDGDTTWAFQWPRSGPVDCQDWTTTPTCGHGLHGLAWGDGDWSLLKDEPDSVWMVVAVDQADLVKIDEGKVKFRRGEVVFAGSKGDAIARVLAGAEAMTKAQRAAREWDEKSGYSSTAASSGYSSTAASSGSYSTAASSGNSSKAASSGYSGIAASIGTDGRAKAGPLGLVIVTYWAATEERYRACVGNVGEDGILADTWYIVVEGKLVANGVENV